MPEPTIANDATISDVVSDLNAPTAYVRGVLEHMWECKQQHGAASVRIGVTGKGRAPHYRIEYPKSPSAASVFAVYHGSSHKAMDDLGKPAELIGISDLLDDDDPSKPKKLYKNEPSPDRILMDDHWSSRVMTLDEVAAVIGQLRQRRR
jgi:hypothetical protein